MAGGTQTEKKSAVIGTGNRLILLPGTALATIFYFSIWLAAAGVQNGQDIVRHHSERTTASGISKYGCNHRGVTTIGRFRAFYG